MSQESKTGAPAAKLAIDGGEPVRTAPLPDGFHGPDEIDEAEIEAAAAVLRRRKLFRYASDPSVSEAARLEREFAALTGRKYAQATSGGTTALIAGLVGIGASVGDEVIVPGYTYIATASACLIVGAIPVIAEIDESLTIDPADVERKVTAHTRAIIPVHMRGLPCDMDRIMEVARRHGLRVLEDVAQACGGRYKGRSLGGIGDAGTFSFQQYKVMTAGEGGMVVTDDEAAYLRAACRHDSAIQFWKPDMDFKPFAGENFRLSDVAAAIALTQLGRVDGILDATRRTKRRVASQLDGLRFVRPAPCHDPEGDCGIALVLLADSPESARRFSEALAAEGVRNDTIYNKGVPDRHIYCHWDYVLEKYSHDGRGWPWSSPLYRGNVEYSPDMCPRTLDVLGRAVCLGIQQHWTEADADDVATAIRKVDGALAERG